MGRSDVKEPNMIICLLPSQLPPLESKESENVTPKLDPEPLDSFPPPSSTHPLSTVTTSQGGLGSMGLSATVRERLRSKFQKAQVRSQFLWTSLCGQATKASFWNVLCFFFFLVLGASRLTPWCWACCFSLLLFYRVNEGCLHLQRWASLDW